MATNSKSPVNPTLEGALSDASAKMILLKLELLKKNNLFSSLADSGLEQLARKSPEIHLKKNDVLFQEGTREKKMFIILSGKILICKGKHYQKPIAVLTEGDYLGESPLVDNSPRMASAKALEETLLMEIGQALFMEHMASQPKALLEMMKVCSRRIRTDVESMMKDVQSLSNFTHDMRNCLVPLGTAEILLEDLLNHLRGTEDYHQKRKGWEEVQKSLETMLATKKYLITIIDQSLAYLKHVQTEYLKSDLEILPLIEETVEELSCHKDLAGKRILIRTATHQKKALFNYLDIKRVIQNLLLNAGYMTEKNGTIEINIKNLKKKIKVTIKDYGDGIPKDIQQVLFKENYTSKPDGNGFGLMSVREIIKDYHQGDIGFKSEAGKGATFYFTLPRAG